MARTLHLPGDPRSVDEGFAALGQLLGGGKAPRPYQLNAANALWGQQGLGYLPEFLHRAESGFGAGLRPVDFREDPGAARRTINAWVEAQTRDKIKDLLGPADVTAGTDLILTNAVYFKGTWAVPFPKSSTRDDPFHGGARPISAPTMHLTDQYGYFESADLQALRLPYLGNDLGMVVLLPRRRDGLAEIEATLTAGVVEGWIAGLARRRVEVALPRFRVEAGIGLGGILAGMGMPTAFGPRADFGGITADRPLQLSGVIHKAFVDVNEEGTEAAAATAVMMKSQSIRAPVPPVVFRADHPFLFLIRDDRSGSILFLGRVEAPQG